MIKAQKDRIYKDVEFLTNIRPYRNYRNLSSLEKVCDYIRNEFEALELPVEEQKWKAAGNEYKNLIVSYNPQTTRRLVIGAHYDVCGDQAGADDNASAVAGLLETARLIAANKPDIDYRIDFVAYCLEEPPFFGSSEMGSHIHAKSLYDDGIDVIGMICYEMIGYFSDELNPQPYPSAELAKMYPHTANFIIVVGIEQYAEFNNRFYEAMKKDAKIDVQVISFPTKDSLAGLSDHSSYWKFGYKALMINDTAFIRSPNYHMPTDTIDTLDFDKLTEVVNSTYTATSGIDWSQF